jgi:phosphoribosylformylglycinamidine cyclo-ligase
LTDDWTAEIDLEAIDAPQVFGWLQTAGGVADLEMLRTFNCGVGMIAVVAAGQAAQVAAVLTEAGEAVMPIGRIVPRREAGVIYRGTIEL